MSQLYWQKILNLTPDSFSDGGELPDYSALLSEFYSAYDLGVRCFDFGAQSTAPTSAMITGEVERDRLKKVFLPFLRKIGDDYLSNCNFSFDTFREQTINLVLNWFGEIDSYPKSIFWNDVSGIIDNASLNFLSQSTRNKIILCHNLVSCREESPSHHLIYDKANDKDFLANVIDYFFQLLDKVPREYHRQIVIDPCFGFSKTYEQNIYLLDNIETFVDAFDDSTQFLLGASRKRFLRQLSGFSLDEIDLLDDFHDNIIKDVASRLESTFLYIRSHRCLPGKITATLA